MQKGPYDLWHFMNQVFLFQLQSYQQLMVIMIIIGWNSTENIDGYLSQHKPGRIRSSNFPILHENVIVQKFVLFRHDYTILQIFKRMHAWNMFDNV